MDLVSGSVGEGVAISFMAYRKIADQLPNPAHILEGSVKKLGTDDISVMYSLVISMCYELQDAQKLLASDTSGKWHEMADNFFRFMMDNFGTEIVVMGVRLALTTYNLPIVPGELKSFDEFHKRFGKYIINSSQS